MAWRQYLDHNVFPPCSEHQKQRQQKGSGSSEASPGRPRSMAGLDVQVNAAAFDGESWRERSSSDGKILKKTAS